MSPMRCSQFTSRARCIILDNLFQAVLPQHRVSQYLPYYSVNEKARFSHLLPNGRADGDLTLGRGAEHGAYAGSRRPLT